MGISHQSLGSYGGAKEKKPSSMLFIFPNRGVPGEQGERSASFRTTPPQPQSIPTGGWRGKEEEGLAGAALQGLLGSVAQ